MHDTLDERILSACDVCNNCLQIVREERETIPPSRRRSHSTVREAEWSRNTQTTTVEYAPADHVTESKGVFCECGVEGSFIRVWDGAAVDIHAQIFDHEAPDVDWSRFKRLVQNAMRTLETKGVSLDRRTFAGHALSARRDGASVNEALSAGATHGLAKAEVDARVRTSARAPADD